MTAGRKREPINHGTVGGYRTHFRHGVPVCEPCRAAERKRKGFKAPQKQAVCGTRGGYHRHLRLGEQACPECREAENKAKRERPRPGLPPGDPRHGTENGYEYYGCRCEACYQVKQAKNRQRYLRRAGAA